MIEQKNQTQNYRITSISLPIDKKSEDILREFRMLCAKDNWNFSEGVWHAIKEYVERHAPGNPQLTFDSQATVIFPTSAKETLKRRNRRPSDCPYWSPRPKAQLPYEAWCSRSKRMVLAASCCDFWKV